MLKLVLTTILISTFPLTFAAVHVHSTSKDQLTLEYEQCDQNLTNCQDIGDVSVMDGPYGTLPKNENDTKVGTPSDGKVLWFYEYIGADTAWWKPVSRKCTASDGQNIYFDYNWKTRAVTCTLTPGR